MKAGIIVVTYNNLRETTAPCLESVFARTSGADFEVVAVDNGSTDGTPSWLARLSEGEPRLRCVFNATNRGFAGGNNDGLRAASGDILVFLNSDTVVAEGWLERLAAPLLGDPSVGIAGPVSNAVGNEQRIFTRGRSVGEILEEGRRWTEASRGDAFETDRLGFFCAAVRKDVVDAVGGMDEAFGPGFFEDDDYCLRVRGAGYRLVCVEDAFVYHRGSTSFGEASPETAALLKRNRKLLEAKHGPYRPRHPRDRQLDLVASYLARAEAGGATVDLVYRIRNRIAAAESREPRGLVKRIRFGRRLRGLKDRLEALAR